MLENEAEQNAVKDAFLSGFLTRSLCRRRLYPDTATMNDLVMG